jgi:hypothetical protein
MKVVLKYTVYDRLRDEIEKAQAGRRLVDYVVVTNDEYVELRNDERADYSELSPGYLTLSAEPQNATMEVKTFERKIQSIHRSPYIRVVSREKFRGIPLYVVPQEFHP